MVTKNITIEQAMNVAASHGGVVFSSENIVYLMGATFVLGSLFTILILILLDFMKRDRVGAK
jgi:hypothetical protein